MDSNLMQRLISENNIRNSNDVLRLLQLLQIESGCISQQNISDISKYLGVPESKVYSLATFYNFFRFTPKGKYHIEVCNGTSCHVKNKHDLCAEVSRLTGLYRGQTSKDGMLSLEFVNCLGACAQGPVVKINETYYTRVDTQQLSEIISGLLKKSE